MGSPEAEVDIDAALVRALLAEQHADLAGLPLRALDAGWDNSLWRLGDDLVVRLPRRAAAVPLAVNEQRWLPSLAAALPLPVPAPARVGVPSDRFAWPWSIVPWIEGEPGDRAVLVAPDLSAARLGAFLAALHRPAPADAPVNAFRGVPVAERSAGFADRLAGLAAEVDADALRTVWRAACEAPAHAGPPVWLHGDLHPANVVVHHGRLAGVVDFGDVTAGDPATDVAAAWMLLPVASFAAFGAAYGGVAAALAARARGWAALFGLLLLGIGRADKPTYEAVARGTLDRVVTAGL